MKHRNLLALTLTAGFALSAMATPCVAEGKFGYVSAVTLIQKSSQAIAANKKMEQDFAPRKNKLESEFNAIRKQEEKLVKEAQTMSEALRNKAIQDLNTRKAAFNQSQQQFQDDLNKRRSDEVQKLQKTISDIIAGIGKKEGYDMIFTEGVAYAKDSANLTERVLRQLNGK